jgi:riboflavin kinase/FMN adenylyltransferase
VADAAIALGRPYTLIGKIVPGRGKGKQIGFPTANLDCHQKSPLGDALRHLQPTGQLVPQQGVYAGFVGIADSQEQACATKERIPAAFSIGRSEDVCTGESLLIEAHLLIEDVGPLYGKWLAMDFIERLREQQRFKTDAELSAQIAKDCIVARKILN